MQSKRLHRTEVCVLNERKMYKFVGNDPAFDNNMYRTNRVNAMLLPPERWITALRHKFHQLAHFIQASNLWQHYFGDSLSYSICYYSPFWVVKCALCIWLTSNETRSTSLSPFFFVRLLRDDYQFANSRLNKSNNLTSYILHTIKDFVRNTRYNELTHKTFSTLDFKVNLYIYIRLYWSCS